MGETIGVLTVKIVRGSRLVIRDFMSSDPYVLVTVENQTKKTRVINSCLNPVWNEELSFSIREPHSELKLEVFDKDLIKSDDKMGHAHISLQPIISATKYIRALHLTSGEHKLRKMAPDIDNCLLDDSFVTYSNGEIVQDVLLRLCDVESGELFLTLKWVERSSGVGR